MYHDPREAHDQQSANIPLQCDRPMEDLRASANISMSCLVDGSTASHEDALNLGAGKFVHRRSSILRRTKFKSLEGLTNAYSDFFGISSLDENHKPAAGISDRLRHIMLDSSHAFRVPKLVLHMFSIRRTYESDSGAFLHAHIPPKHSVESMSRMSLEPFRQYV